LARDLPPSDERLRQMGHMTAMHQTHMTSPPKNDPKSDKTDTWRMAMDCPKKPTASPCRGSEQEQPNVGPPIL
jgi:hypothetical protein